MSLLCSLGRQLATCSHIVTQSMSNHYVHCTGGILRPPVFAQRPSVADRYLRTCRTCLGSLRTENQSTQAFISSSSSHDSILVNYTPPSLQPSHPAPDDAPSPSLPVDVSISEPLLRRRSILAMTALVASFSWLQTQQSSASNVTLPQQRQRQPKMIPPVEEPIKIQIADVQLRTKQAVDAAAIGDYQQVCVMGRVDTPHCHSFRLQC